MSKQRELLARRRTVHFWPTSVKRPGGLNAHMFIEDIGLQVAPIGGRVRDRPNFRVRCDPEDEVTQRRVMAVLDPWSQHRHHDLSEVVCEFVRTHTQFLATFGEEHFELLAAHDDGALIPLGPTGVRRIGPWLLQVPPSSIAAQAARRFIWLTPAQSWTLRLPASLGPAWRHRQMLRGLGLRVTSPQWAYNAMLAGRRTDFDQATHQRLINDRILRCTRRWSWPAREMGSGSMTVYEQMRRRLGFGLVLTELREHMVTEINSMFARLHLNARLSFEGLASVNEIRSALVALEHGSLPFQELLPIIRW